MGIQERAAAIFAGLTFRLILIGIIGVMFLNTYVDLRVPIPLLPDIHWEGWAPKAKRLQHTIDGFAKAQEQARILAEQQLKAKEAEYRDKARKADDEYDQTQAATGDAVARYISTHRFVCPSNRGAASGAPASPESGNPGVPESLPPTDLVSVSDSDVRACAANAAYAVAAHRWALSLEKGD